MPANPYIRLPGRRLNSFVGQPSLWLGGDHVLKVNQSGYNEEYRRFYFADIRGFVVQPTQGMLVWLGVLGLMFAGLGLLGANLWTSVDSSDHVMGAVFTVILLIVNLVKGPSCKFYIKTAIQTDRLPSISRIKSAEALIAALTPIIMEAQKAPSATTPSDATPVPGP
jgi:hypothetical protein